MNDDADDGERRRRLGWRIIIALGVALIVGKLYMNVPRAEPESRHLTGRREILRQLLSRVSNILRQSQVSHWLAFGTLKSWHESRRIATTAYDIDLAVLAQQVPLLTSALINSLPSDEYLVIPASVVLGTLVVHRETGLLLELTSYADHGDGILRPTSPCVELRNLQCHAQREFPATFVFPIYSDMLDGVDVPVPNHYLRLLDAWYANGELCRAPAQQAAPTPMFAAEEHRPSCSRQ